MEEKIPLLLLKDNKHSRNPREDNKRSLLENIHMPMMSPGFGKLLDCWPYLQGSESQNPMAEWDDQENRLHLEHRNNHLC